MVIIYGGIQPHGLVLSKHTITIDTSKNGIIADPRLTTQRPTLPPSPPPIRGTVPPLSKWGIYDRPTKHPPPPSAKPSQDELEELNELVEKWAKNTFQFGANDQETKEEELGEMENLLLNTLDQLAAQYSNISKDSD